MTRKETACTTFGRGFNCCQAVLSAFAEELGLDTTTALKIAGGFGGGMRKGEVCGAVTGAIMALGLRYGHSKADAVLTKKRMNDLTVVFIETFERRNRSIICKKLLGYDISRIEEYRQADSEGVFTIVCPKIIEDAVSILEEML